MKYWMYKWKDLETLTKEELCEIIVEQWEFMRIQSEQHSKDLNSLI